MKKISYPNIGNYTIPVNYLLKNISKYEVIQPKNNTSKTISLGEKLSPDFICTPFKYTLGNFLENEADIYIQLGGGCKYGYYHDLQREILKEKDKNIEVINLISRGKSDIKYLYKTVKKISNKNIINIAYYLIKTKKIVNQLDLIEDKIRKIRDKNNFNEVNAIHKKYLNSLDYKNCLKELNKIKSDNNIKIALIGELFTLMDPYANMQLEEMLNKNNVSITRNTNATYLLFKKKEFFKKNINKSKYISTKMAADASENILLCEQYCNEGYDAIIHIKSSFCTPEIGAMQILNKVCKDFNVPIIFLNFDSNTSKTGLETRIEALLDIIEMRKSK